MNKIWALQDAKNKLSKLVDLAVHDGPQTITRRGKETAIVVSVEDFRKLTSGRDSLVSFLRDSPLAGVDLDLERSGDYGREVEL